MELPLKKIQPEISKKALSLRTLTSSRYSVVLCEKNLRVFVIANSGKVSES